MSALRFLAGIFLVAMPLLATAVDREVKRTFAVEPGCTLELETYRGVVTIEESDTAEISVIVALDVVADSEAAAERLLGGVKLDFRQAANVVAIRATNPRETGVRIDVGEEDRVDLIYRITVPRSCNVTLRAIEGNFTVGNLAGRMVARLETGAIFFRRIEGSIEAHTQMGDVTISRCSGAVTATVLRGVIRLGTIGGPIDVRNTTGDIDVLTAKVRVTAAAEAGDITVGFGPGIAGDSRLTVAGGSIVAKIHPAAACRVEAATTWGRVECALPLAIEAGGAGRRHLAGRLNGGGATVTLRASGGSVKITGDVALIDEPTP